MKKYRYLLLIFIFIIGVFFRYFHFDRRYGIGYDGSRDALVSFESVRERQLPLTGSFSSIGPITFGPLYYYYLIAANYLLPTPWAPWMAIGFASLLMIPVLYLVGTHLLNWRLGLFISFLVSVSPAQILASMQLQQHALIGFLSSLAILLLVLVLKKPTTGSSFLWGFEIGFAFNTHFQSGGLLTLPFLFFIFKRNFRLIPSFLFGLFVSMVPILFFEVTNHWFNTRNIIDYIFIGQYRVWTSNRWLTFAGIFIPDFWAYVTGLPKQVSATLFVTTVLIFIYKTIRRSISLPFIIIFLSFAIQIIVLRYYRGEKFFGYLQFFHPYLFLFTGYILFLLVRRVRHLFLQVIIIAAFLGIILPSSFSQMKDDVFNRQTAKRYEALVSLYPNEKFSAYECKNVRDFDRIQGVILLLYMNKRYDEGGRKIVIANPYCTYVYGKQLSNDLVDVNEANPGALADGGLFPRTPRGIYEETARWYFKEQP